MADKKELSEGKKLEESLFYKKENFFGPPFPHRFIAAQTKGGFLYEILFFSVAVNRVQ